MALIDKEALLGQDKLIECKIGEAIKMKTKSEKKICKHSYTLWEEKSRTAIRLQ